MSLPNYDAWKLATPPEYEAPDTCPSCGDQDGFHGDRCDACGWDADDEDAAYSAHIDAKIDEAQERGWDR